MSVLAPGFLFGLLLALPLAAIYLLKVRPRRHDVTAWFLWDRVFVERRSSALFRRLRDALSLVLMLAALGLAVLAAARPTFEAGDDRDVVLVIDRSVSMSAGGGPAGDGRPGLAAAKAEARRIVAALGGGRRAAVATVADELAFASGLTDDPRTLREAIDAIEPSDLPSRAAALAPIERATAVGDRLRVLLLTDGVGERFRVPGGVEVLPVGGAAAMSSRGVAADAADGGGAGDAASAGGGAASAGDATRGGGDGPAPGDRPGAGSDAPAAGETASETGARPAAGENAAPPNLGFAAADLLAAPGSAEMVLFFRVASSHEVPVDVEVRLERAGAPVKIVPLTVEPGLGPPQVFTATGGSGRYVLALARAGGDGAGAGPAATATADADALAADDVAHLVAHAPDPVRVAVGGARGPFFALAVRAFDRAGGLLRLHQGAAADGTNGTAGARGADVVVRTGADPPGAASDLAIVFAPIDRAAAEASGLPALGAAAALGAGDAGTGEPVPAPLPRLIAERHPALRFLPVEELAFAGARDLRAPEGAAVLVRDAGGAHLVWQERDGDRLALVFNLDPAAGDFVLSPFFPLMVHGAATHLGGRTDRLRATWPTGAIVRAPGLRPGEAPRVLGPDELAAPAAAPDDASRAPDDDAAARNGDPAAPNDDRAAPHSDPAAANGDRAAPNRDPAAATATASAGVRLDAAGPWRTVASGATTDLAASVLAPAESLLAPSPAAAVEPPAIPRGRPPWMLLAIAALLVLALEEVLYHRRKVG